MTLNRSPGPQKIPRLLLLALIIIVSVLSVFSLDTQDPQRAQKSEWKLIWSDEFDGPEGSRVNEKKWTTEIGGSGWGNHELQYYTNRPANAYQSNGLLIIRARKEHYTGSDKISCAYTSARLTTRKTFTTKYGRIEARIKVPYGQGIWPAFWMLGNNIREVGWPRSGEIDIMEHIGKEPAKIHGTIHGPGYSSAKGLTTSYWLKNGERFSDSFHVFAVEWEPNEFRFYCDDVLYQRRTPADLPARARWVFDHPFFILLNLAVGGTWPGSPDETTTFPQQMLVDYVRVYQRSTAVERIRSITPLL